MAAFVFYSAPLRQVSMKNLSESDALFALPLADFTAARNALAARLKKEGRAEEAQRVKSLAKPSARAWAVNQLYWRHRPAFDRLLSVNETVRDAQMGRSGDLRALLAERRKAVFELASVAMKLLSEAGHAASAAARHRVVTTLESLAALDASNIEREAGRLTADLPPFDFDNLAALLEGTPPATAKVFDFRQGAKKKQDARRKQDAREKQRVRDEQAFVQKQQSKENQRAERVRAEARKLAETALSNARRETARAEATAARAVKRKEALEEEKREIEARLEVAIREATAADEAVKKAHRIVAEAERVLARTGGGLSGG